VAATRTIDMTPRVALCYRIQIYPVAISSGCTIDASRLPTGAAGSVAGRSIPAQAMHIMREKRKGRQRVG
jgi:hypothetical protein